MNEEIYKITEDNSRKNELSVRDSVSTDLQRALINMLHGQGVLNDHLYEATLKKINKGVI